MYVSAKKYQQALTVIQTAQAKDGQNYLLAEAGGQAAYALGDKPQTITYYKEVLKLLPKSLQDYIEEARDYQQTIQQLEQSP
jgi:tetratricopeptide (TPR) repeat protein